MATCKDVNSLNEKAQMTIKKIEDVKKSNFDKEDMSIFWSSYISHDRNFCDVIFALIEHKKNNDNIKFTKKLEKTAEALSLPSSYLTPFILNYFILWTSKQEEFNKHISKLSQLILNEELEEKTNIKDVAQGRAKSNKNRFCLSTEKKLLISNSLDKLNISNETNYIDLIDDLSLAIKDDSFNVLMEEIEQSIEEYNEELMHTVNGKKEYVFKEDEVVGTSKLKFNYEAKNIIDSHKYIFNIFIRSLDLKFPNIVAKYDDGVFEYKLLNQISKKKVI